MISGGDVSVVVSTYNRPTLVTTLVACLQRQTAADLDVVIVDNGSTAETSTALRAAVADDPRFRLLRIDDNRGPASARNLGWRSSRRPFIAFTDDDCLPEPSWLENLLSAVDDPRMVVQGRTVPPAGETPTGWFDRSVWVTAWSDRYETCNLLISAELLRELDGFVEDFPVAMGEDTDLGFRAVAAGASTAFAADAVVHHVWWRQNLRDFLRHRKRHAELVQLFARNPETRRLLAGRIVARWLHVVVWGLVVLTPASVVLGYGWLTPALITLWSLRLAHKRRHLPISPPRRVLYAFATFLGFVYETGAFAVASVRHRRLVI